MAKLNDNFTLRAPVPIDDKMGWWDEVDGEWKPFNNRQHALDLTPYYRFRTLTLPVMEDGDVVEYWFKMGVEDSDFIIKTPQTAVTWENITGDQSVVGNAGFTNNAGYITASDLPDLSNYLQVGDNISLLNNDAGYITLADIPPVDLSNYYTKTELQTPGDAVIVWDNIVDVPDFATDWGSITGDQSVVGNAGFTNDANYITEADLPDLSDYLQSGDNISELVNNVGYITDEDLPDLSNYLQIGDNVSELVNDAGYITTNDLPELADVAYSGDYNDLINTPTIPDLTGYATEQWVLDQNYITGVAWDEISGDQSDIGNAGFANTANYITIDDVPSAVNADWEATSGLAEILNKPTFADVAFSGDYEDLINQPSIPDLSGYATEAWVTSQGYLTAVTSSWNVNTGDLTIQGDVHNLDGRYMLRSNTIGAGYGIIASEDFTSAVSIEVDTDVLDNRYLRKDQNDSTPYGITAGILTTGSLRGTNFVLFESLMTGDITDDMLVIDNVGLVKRIPMPSFGGEFTIANNAGTPQFTVDSGETIRFNATGDASIAFNAGTKTITINSSGGSSGGGVDSWNARTGAVVPEAGDYNTSLVDEDPSALYFTQARVRSTTLTGLVFGSGSILPTDTVLQALGKLQSSVSDRATTATTLTINGTAGNITVSGGTQTLAANRTWTVNLVNKGTAGTYTKVTTDAQGRVTAGGVLTVSDLPSSVIQTLGYTAPDSSPSSTSGGTVSISDGNSISIDTLSSASRPDADLRYNGHVFSPYYTASGNTGYPSTSNAAGWRVERRSTNTSQLGMEMWTSGATASGGPIIYARNFSGENSYSDWQVLATRDWVTSQLPTNYVTTNSSQSGLSGNKSWTGNHTYTNTLQIYPGGSGGWARGLRMYTPDESNSYEFYAYGGTSTVNYAYIGRSYNDAILKANDTGIGIGISGGSAPANPGITLVRGTPGTTGIWFGSISGVSPGSTLRTNGAGATLLSGYAETDAIGIYLRPNGEGSGDGQISINQNGTVIVNGLSGSGTQMVTVTSNGTLGRAAIPSAQTLSLGTGAGQITISGGNSISLNSLSTGSSIGTSFVDWMNDTPNQSGGFFSSTTGATGLPTTTGLGLYARRLAGTLNGSMVFWTANNGGEDIYYTTGSGTTLNPWKVLADKDWVNSQIPIDYVGVGGSGAPSPSSTLDVDGLGNNNSIHYLGSGSPNLPSVAGSAGGSVINMGYSGNSQYNAQIYLQRGVDDGFWYRRYTGTWYQGASREWVQGYGLGTTVLPGFTLANFDDGTYTMFMRASSAANTPFATVGVGINLSYAANRSGQLWLSSSTSQQYALQFRTQTSGNTWSPVRTVWHDGNFTPGDYQQTITGGASTIVTNNLTANRALISNGSGKVAVSAVTSTELGYLDGVTSNVQTQLNAKVPTSRQVNSGTGLTGGGNLTANRTLSVVYGTASGTAAQGNDSRINNGQNAYNNFFSVNPNNTNNLASSTSNLDTVTGAGAFNVNTNSTGLPWSETTISSTVLNLYGNASNSAQILIPTGGTGYSGVGIWWRERQGNPWREFYHTGNLNISNFVTTNTSQSNIGGNKSWTGRHVFNTTTSASAVQGAIDIGGNANGQFIRAGRVSDGSVSFSLRGYTSGPIQMQLYDGGYSAPRGSATTNGFILLGDNAPVIGASTGGAVALMADTGNVLLKPNGTGTAGMVTIATSGQVTVAGLSGSGTQMVTVNASGVLNRQAIPSSPTNYVTTNSSQTGLSGNKTWTGNHGHSGNFAVTGTTTLNSLNVSGTSIHNTLQVSGAAIVSGNLIANGNIVADSLSGSGTRMVVANGDGVLSTQAIPAVSLVSAGSATVGAVRYAGSTRTNGQFYGGTTVPNVSNRLNYNGVLHAYDFIGYGTSDRRLKENIVPIANPLEKLSQISGYSFKWKDGNDSYSGDDYGVIAQEVEKILPNMVIRRDDGVLGIKKENQLTALLIEAIKELQKEVEALKNGIS